MRAVVLATGAFQTPTIPSLAGAFSAELPQFTVETYKNAVQLPLGTALVVGDGATGRDIAQDILGSRPVILAAGRSRQLLPERVLGKSTWWWLDKLGVVRVSGDSRLGRRIKKADAFPGRGKTLKHLARQGVRVRPRLVDAQGTCAGFADRTSAEVTSVIWATGYRDNSAWVALPEVMDEHGNFVQRHGLSPVPNFYFIGRSWQRSRGSALITGVGEDARYLTEHIVKRLGRVGARDEAVDPLLFPERGEAMRKVVRSPFLDRIRTHLGADPAKLAAPAELNEGGRLAQRLLGFRPDWEASGARGPPSLRGACHRLPYAVGAEWAGRASSVRCAG
jgi:cation diffusion facilitator CzcD-associated flavoprotein CzcO